MQVMKRGRLKRLQEFFLDYRFTEIIDFSDVVLHNFGKAKRLKTFPASFGEVEKVFEVTRYIGKSRGDKSSGNWLSAERFSKEVDSSVIPGLDMNVCLKDFVL